MSPVRLLTLVVCVVVLIGQGALASGGPKPATPTASDRCAACGMAVTPHPAWLAQIVYSDGAADFFDGPKCMFKALKGVAKKKAAMHEGKIAGVFVTSYYDHVPIDAETAWYVHGSDVRGPMGNELVPHGSKEEAEEFLRDHAGKGIVRWGEVSVELLKSL